MSMTPEGIGGVLELPSFETIRSSEKRVSHGVMSFRDMVALAFKFKYRVLTALILPPAIAFLLVQVIPPVYRAETSLVVGTGHEYLAQGEGSSVLTAPTATKQEFINTEMELLADPAVIKDTITRFGLANLYPRLAATQDASQSSMDAAVRAFQSSLKIEPVKLSNVIRVSFGYSDPQTAAHVLDLFVASYQELHSKVYANRRAGSYAEIIGREMQGLDKLERARADAKADYGIYDLSQQRSALIQQRVDAVRRLAETSLREDILQKRLAYLTETRPHLATQIESTQTETNTVSTHAREMLVDLRQREAVMAVTYDASNPMLMRLRQQIQTVQSQLASMKDTTTRMSLNQSPIASWVDQEIITSRAELAPLTDQKLHDKEQLEKIDDELRHIEQADIKIRVLDSRIGDQNENLKTMRQLYSKVRSEDEMDLAKVTSVVQTADSMALDRPVAPNKLFFAVGGILAGLISACGVIVFVTITNRTFLSDESLERYLGLPVLGSMPLQAHERRRLV